MKYLIPVIFFIGLSITLNAQAGMEYDGREAYGIDDDGIKIPLWFITTVLVFLLWLSFKTRDKK